MDHVFSDTVKTWIMMIGMAVFAIGFAFAATLPPTDLI